MRPGVYLSAYVAIMAGMTGFEPAFKTLRVSCICLLCYIPMVGILGVEPRYTGSQPVGLTVILYSP